MACVAIMRDFIDCLGISTSDNTASVRKCTLNLYLGSQMAINRDKIWAGKAD